MWTKEGSHDEGNEVLDFCLGQPAPFRYSGASEKAPEKRNGVGELSVVVGKERIPRQNGWKIEQRRMRDETTTVKRKGSIENGFFLFFEKQDFIRRVKELRKVFVFAFFSVFVCLK